MNESLTAMDVAREYFPDKTDRELNAILWEHTGFPGFFPDNLTIEEAIRADLAKYKEEVSKDGENTSGHGASAAQA